MIDTEKPGGQIELPKDPLRTIEFMALSGRFGIYTEHLAMVADELRSLRFDAGQPQYRD